MTNSDSKSIVAFYLDALHSIIPSAGSQDIVFRGLENKVWGLESTVYLRHANPPTHSDFIQYNCDLIARAKNANYHHKENNELTDIELLAELRHYGAATALFDFTRDFLVALWFASRPWKENDIQTDGKVIIVNIGDSNVFLQLTSEDREKSLDKILNFKTREEQTTPDTARSEVDTSTLEISDQKNTKLWYWQPRFAINHRLSAQKGVFIFGKAAIDTADIQNWGVIISQEHKEAIHRELSDHFSINEDSLFNDLPGFAMVNDKAHKIQTRTADDYLENAVQHRQRGEFDHAIQSLDKAIELDQNKAVYHSFRGAVNYDLKSYEDALEDFTKAIGLNPDNAFYHYNRGRVNHDLGKHEDALKDFTKAIGLNPDYAVYHYFRGQVNRDLGKHEDALKDFTKAIGLNPDDAYYHYNRGRANHDLEKHEDALKDFTKAIGLHPDESFYHYMRGQVNRDLGKHEDALKDFTKAIGLDPDKSFYHYFRGEVNRDFGKHEDAQRDFDKAKELNLNSSDPLPENN